MLALGGLAIGRAGDERLGAVMVACAGTVLAIRAVLLLTSTDLLKRVAARDQDRSGNRVSARVGATFRSTRPLSLLELIIAIGLMLGAATRL